MSASLQKLIQEDQLWFAKNNDIENVEQKLASAFCNSSIKARSYVHQKSNDYTATGISSIDETLPEGGLLHGAVHEFIVQGTGLHGQPAKLFATKLITRHIEALLKQSQLKEFSKLIVWISRGELPAPFVLLNGLMRIQDTWGLQQSLLSQCIFLTPNSDREILKAIDILLGSPAVSMLVAELPTIPFAAERRFAVRTKNYNIFSVFLREGKALKRNSPSHSRWSICPAPTELELPVFTLTLENKKGLQPAIRSWQMVFDDTDDVFEFKDASKINRAVSLKDIQTDAARLVS